MTALRLLIGSGVLSVALFCCYVLGSRLVPTCGRDTKLMAGIVAVCAVGTFGLLAWIIGWAVLP